MLNLMPNSADPIQTVDAKADQDLCHDGQVFVLIGIEYKSYKKTYVILFFVVKQIFVNKILSIFDVFLSFSFKPKKQVLE